MSARLAIVLPSGGFAGAERQAWLVALRLREAGHTVAIHAMAGGQGLAERCRARALELLPLPRVESRWRPLAAWRMRRAADALLAWRPGALLPFCSAPNVLCGLVAAGGGPPMAWNQRDEGLFPQHPDHEGRALAAARVLTANGPGAAAWLAQRTPAPVRIIPNATVPEAPLADRPTWRQRLELPAEAVLAVMLATLSPAKDHATLLRAWALVEAGLPAAWLALAGADGGEGARLRRLVAALGLKRVRWLDATDDPSGLLGAADLGVLVSRSEGLSNAVLEYRAAGLAVVGSDVPGVRAAAGEGALLVAPGEAEALAGTLRELLGDPARRAELASRSRHGLVGAEGLDAWLAVVDDLLRKQPA